jgi:exo-poly-alpha-galacturonosidase
MRSSKKILLSMMLVMFGLVFLGLIIHADVSNAPKNLHIPTLAYDQTTAVLTWNKPDGYYEDENKISDYEVWIDGSFHGLSSANFAANYKYLSAYYNSFYNASAQVANQYRVKILSYLVTDLVPNHSYVAKVRSVYGVDHYSSFSEEFTFKTALPYTKVVDASDQGVEYITKAQKTSDAVFSNVVIKNGNGNATLKTYIENNTAALQKAIDETPNGGKLVLKGNNSEGVAVPNADPYYYVVGSIFLHSNITFEIEDGATLLGSPIFDHYPRNLLVYPYSQDMRTYGLINAVTWDYGTISNIRVVGGGSVDGNGWKATASPLQTALSLDPAFSGNNPGYSDPTGNAWRLPSYVSGSSGNVSTNGILAGDAYDKSQSDAIAGSTSSQWYNTRPNLFVTRGVHGLFLGGLSFYNPPFHGIVNYQGENITTVGTNLFTYDTNNGDGIEFGDCLGIELLNNFYDTGDDAINYAAGQGVSVRNEGDRVATGEAHVYNNYVRNGHGGLVAAGSHTGGWIGDILSEENVWASSDGNGAGAVRIKSGATTGGGIRNIYAYDNACYEYAGYKDAALVLFETSYSDSNSSTAFSPESEVPTTFKNINVRNMTVANMKSYLINIGAPGNSILSVQMVIDNVHLSDITILSAQSSGSNRNKITLGGGITNSSFTNINNLTTTAIAVTNSATNKNIYFSNIKNNGTTLNAASSTSLQWAVGSELTKTITGNLVDLSWPAVAGANGYRVLVKDEHSRNYQEKLVTTQTSASFYLEANSSFQVQIEATLSGTPASSSVVNLETSVQTGAASHTPGTITMPTATATLGGTSVANKNLGVGVAGYSWMDIKFNNPTAATYGIHYYRIVAHNNTKNTDRIYYCYYDRTSRNGYSLWDLDHSSNYTVTVYAVDWVGTQEAYNTTTFTTIASTQLELPVWDETASLTIDHYPTFPGDPLLISWDGTKVNTDNLITQTAEFAGFRVNVNGVPQGLNINQVNATPTVGALDPTNYSVDTTNWLPGGVYNISVEAGYNLTKFAGPTGAVSINGTANTTLPRNQITFGKWTGDGPSQEIILPQLRAQLVAGHDYFAVNDSLSKIKDNLLVSLSNDDNINVVLQAGDYDVLVDLSSPGPKTLSVTFGSQTIDLSIVVDGLVVVYDENVYFAHPGETLSVLQNSFVVTYYHGDEVAILELGAYQTSGTLAGDYSNVTISYLTYEVLVAVRVAQFDHLSFDYTNEEIVYANASYQDLRDHIAIYYHYDNGSSIEFTNYQIAGSIQSGLCTFLVIIDEQIVATFSQEFSAIEAVSIEATLTNNQLNYGVTLNEIKYLISLAVLNNDGSNFHTWEFDLTGDLHVGLNTINVIYGELTDTIEVEILNYVVGISSEFTQGQLQVLEGSGLESLLNNLVVELNWADGSTSPTATYALSGNLNAGYSLVWVEYLGHYASFLVFVEAIRPIRIEASLAHNSFNYGISLSELKYLITLEVFNNNDTSFETLDFQISGYLNVGINSIKVVYGTFSTTVGVEIINYVVGIDSSFNQGELNIFEGASLNALKNSLVVYLNWADGSNTTITNYTLSGDLEAGYSLVWAEYNGHYSSFLVRVRAVEVVGIEIDWDDSVSYQYESSIQTIKNDLVVRIVYNNGAKEEVKDYLLQGRVGEGDNTFNVSYHGNQASFTVKGQAPAKTLSAGGGIGIGIAIVVVLVGIALGVYFIVFKRNPFKGLFKK